MIPLASRKILVVEDEPLIRLDLQDILTELGATVLEAETVRRARAIVLETAVDAAILDVIMPDGDTYPLAREFLMRGVKVLFVTGIARGMPPDLAHCPVVEKPFSDHVLGRAVATLLQRKNE